MQEAARACPASAPCPGRDARTRVCAGVGNRTRNASNATLMTLNWSDAVRLSKAERRACFLLLGPAQLPAYELRLRSTGTGLNLRERPAAQLDDKLSRLSRGKRQLQTVPRRDRPIDPCCGPSATNLGHPGAAKKRGKPVLYASLRMSGSARTAAQRQDRNSKLLRALDCVRRDACYFTLGATRDSADATAALPFSRKGREPHRPRDVLWIIEVSEASEITA